MLHKLTFTTKDLLEILSSLKGNAKTLNVHQRRVIVHYIQDVVFCDIKNIVPDRALSPEDIVRQCPAEYRNYLIEYALEVIKGD